ncbi:MAG: sialidase family protein, partial [Gemmatimonadota bacterium]
TPVTPSRLAHPASRFFVRRLRSGRLLLVKHGPLAERTERSHLTAYLSGDDGASWQGGLLLDERAGVSYPDGAQAPDGTVYLVYDFERRGARQILLARFTEEDALRSRCVSPRSALRLLVNQAGTA